MHFDHSQEWLRLAAEYRARSDEELLELYQDFADLTDLAQQALTAELQSRGLDKKIAEEKESAAGDQRVSPQRAGLSPALPFIDRDQDPHESSLWGSKRIEPVPDSDCETDPIGDSEQPHEYTWKTVLCEGVEYDQAWQIREVLRRAGIESWLERPGAQFVTSTPGVGMGDIRVLVAADELDRAQSIAANPIPQDIIDESHETVPEYEPPRCPGCGADDPVLESAEPVNAWKCEICGREWSDPAPESQPAGPFT